MKIWDSVYTYQTTPRLVLAKLANDLVPVTFYWRLTTAQINFLYFIHSFIYLWYLLRFVSKKKLQDDPESLLPGGALTILCDLCIYRQETNTFETDPNNFNMRRHSLPTKYRQTIPRTITILKKSIFAIICLEIWGQIVS